jgi:MFS family permease
VVADQGQIRDDELRSHARRRHLMIIATGLSAALLGGVAFGLFAVIHDDASWWTVLLALLPIMVMAAAVLLLVRLQRRGHRWFPQPSRLLGADRPTRRRVSRIVRRGQLPPDEPDRGLGLEMAQAVDRTRWNRWTMLFLAVIFAIEASTTNSHGLQIFMIVYLIVFVPVLAWNWRMYARVHTLVRAHATTAQDGAPHIPRDQFPKSD